MKVTRGQGDPDLLEDGQNFEKGGQSQKSDIK